MTKVAVIGAGPMGLAAAFHLVTRGCSVDVFEAGSRPGGMAAHFDLDGLSIERFYHFVCKADSPTFELLDDLGLGEALRWRGTSMGYFVDGRHYPWGDPVSLLRFPHLDIMSKIRYGLLALHSTRRTDWTDLDQLTAEHWLRRWTGERAWKVVWEKLFTLKFFEHSSEISAAWMWARIKRMGTSRRSAFQEELGYIEGGSETLIDRLCERIRDLNGRIHLSCPTSEIHVTEGAVTGVSAGGQRHAFDAVLSTVPLVLVPDLIPGLPPEALEAYRRLQSIGVVCAVHKLRRSVTPHFWLNINDPAIDVPGIVQFSNLRPTGDVHVVYVPYYMPVTNPKFARSDADVIAESFGYLQRLNPALTESDRIASSVGRLTHAQPICPPGFLKLLPPVVTGVRGLQVADTSCYYPEDRSIAESVRLAKQMADRVHVTAPS